MLWLSLSLFVSLANAKPLVARWDNMKLKHGWETLPAHWVPIGAAPEGATIDLHIKLKSADADALIGTLLEVSDPSHERYGKHLSKEEVAELVAPHSDTHAIVASWLAAHNIAARPAFNGDWLQLDAVPIETANALLDASYQLYEHPSTGETLLRTQSYSLPAALHGHVSVVAPTTFFGTPQAMRATSRVEENTKVVQEDVLRAQALSPDAVPSSCASTITPSCLKALYNTTGFTPAATNRNILAVAGYLQEFANQADLTTFANRFLTGASSATFGTVLINGGQNSQNNPGVEANLDIQYTTGMSFPTPQIYYSTGGSPPFISDDNTPTNTNEPYLNFLDTFIAQSPLPQTLTTSYGDDEQTVPLDFATEVCNLFAQLGTMGTSVMFSSGDFGVGGGDCQTNTSPRKVQFQPIFPATCPFVTSVGGTTSVNPEVAASLSSGGFSNYFAQPSYQTSSVATFLNAIGTQFNGLFNRTGRGFPDVAAQAEHFQVVIGGRVGSVAGTSCSSPTVAGVVSLLNDFRLSEGKSSLGFLNPLLYSTGLSGLNDITSGSNPGCGTAGFTARAGWDPVTGLGTLDFGKLKALLG
ncbi:subtilisin-like protein [Vararia minispora EC-137]|uniref:Subtilisin-like protein n=1 Tax=Vararia minispora EC-137 TaxID=1314806 RepID=A0ACB8QCM7_9AGAM|nr:subtilisin-like protein [Vararia minispora EC-137]